MDKTMLNKKNLSKYFWAKLLITTLLCVKYCWDFLLKQTAFELWHDRKSKIRYFKVFSYKCFILDNKDQLHKFDIKADESIFVGYSTTTNAYRVYNKRTLVLRESVHVAFDEPIACKHMTRRILMLNLGSAITFLMVTLLKKSMK